MSDSETSSNSLAGVGHTILRNTLSITLSSVALKVLNFLFSVLVVRQLGDDRFGQFKIIVAWVGLFAIFAELGVSQYVMRTMARDREQTQPLFSNLIALRLVLAALGIVGITLGAAVVGYSREIVIGVLFYTFTFVLAAVQASLETVLVAHERLDYTSGMQIVGQVTYLLVAGAVLWLNLGLVPFVASGLLAMLPPIVFAVWVVQRHGWLRWKLHLKPGNWMAMIRGGAPFAIVSLALTIAFSIDTVMLSWIVPEAHVGWYNVAYGLVRSLVGFLGAFSVAMVPSLTRAYVVEPALVEHWYYRSVRFITLLTLPVAMGGMLISFPVFGFLYRPSTLPAALVMQILIWDVPLLVFTAFCGNMTTVIGSEREAARIYGINALANVILNLYAIPQYGIIGAAFVTVITDLIGALQFHFYLSRRMRLPAIASSLLRTILATGVMGLVVVLARHWHFAFLIGLGVVVYGLAILVLRLIDPSEWAILVRFLTRYRRRGSIEGPRFDL